jgi:hypothetical protein
MQSSTRWLGNAGKNRHRLLEETTMRWLRRKLMLQCIGAIAWIALQGASVVSAAGTSFHNEVAKALQAVKDAGHSTPSPIPTSTHQASRPGGIPWPPPTAKSTGMSCLRNTRRWPFQRHLARRSREASPLVEDNQRILNLLGHNAFFPFCGPA